MKKTITLLLLLFVLGCNRGDIRISPIVEGQPAPHAGYNIGPELYLQTGDRAKTTGIVIWIDGLDPNDMLGEPTYGSYRVVE